MMLDDLTGEEAYFLLSAIDRNILINETYGFNWRDIEDLTGTFDNGVFKRCPYCIYHNNKEDLYQGKKDCGSCKVKRICNYYESVQRNQERALKYMKHLRSRYGSLLIKKVSSE